VIVIHGEVRPGDLTGMLAKLTGGSGSAELKLESKGNGRYALAEAPLPILIIDAREADDIEGDVIVAGMAPILTADFVGALGEGECKAVTLAIGKTDTSATLWGGMSFDKPVDPSDPKTVALSGNLTGDKLFRGEMTFENEDAAIVTEKLTQNEAEAFGSLMTIKRTGAMLTVESAKSGNLADLLIPGIRGAVGGANQAACRANLSGIGKGCELYRGGDSNAKYPENMKVLIDVPLIVPGVLRCPSDPRQRASGYLYAAPVPDADGRTMMLCDLKGNHVQIRHVTFASGAVRKMTEAQFQAELKLPRNVAFAAALEKAGG
jgi:hypothetical protein